MPFTDADLCSAALVKLGAAPLASLADARIEADVARRLYPIHRDALLASHPWAFCLAQATLVRDTAAPLADFAYAYLLPADLLRTLSASSQGGGRGLVYRIAGTRLHTDSASVTLRYQRRAAEADFAPHFVSALVARLAAELCLPITENATRAEVLHRLARAEAQLARLVDSQQSTPKALSDLSLIEARWS